MRRRAPRARAIAASAVAVLALTLAACGGEPSYDREDLPELVLQKSDAPVGTSHIDGSSGFQTVEQYAEDRTEEKALRDAGFQTAFVAEFLSPELFRPGGELDPRGSLAISFALLFEDRDGALEGLRLVEQDVRADGSDIQQRPTEGLPPRAIALGGTLQRERPPGFLFAWPRGNVVLGLVAAGASGAIDERGARELVRRMDARG